MNTQRWRRVLLTSLVCGPVVLFLLARWQAWFTDPDLLATLIFLELVLAAVWNYRSRFFPLLLGAFLCAGIMFPFSMAFRTGRWLVLAVAAVAGVIVYMKERQLHLTAFHSVSLVCVITALASAAVSARPLKEPSRRVLAERIASVSRTLMFPPWRANATKFFWPPSSRLPSQRPTSPRWR